MSYQLYRFAHFVIQRDLKESLIHLRNKTVNNHVFVHFSITDNFKICYCSYKDNIYHLQVVQYLLEMESENQWFGLVSVKNVVRDSQNPPI
jgi:hypothetical protein